jgi:hypothetical protein
MDDPVKGADVPDEVTETRDEDDNTSINWIYVTNLEMISTTQSRHLDHPRSTSSLNRLQTVITMLYAANCYLSRSG